MIIEKRTKNVELRERKIWILICGAYFSAQRCCQINDSHSLHLLHFKRRAAIESLILTALNYDNKKPLLPRRKWVVLLQKTL